MPDIKLQFRYCLLIYSQSDGLDPWPVSDMLSDLSAECIVAHENHTEGGTHLHAFVDFGRKFRSKNPRILDVQGFHPNIQPCRRTPHEMFDYGTKDREILAEGLGRPPPRTHVAVGNNEDTWSRIANADSSEEFWSLCRELAPRDPCYNFTNVRAFCDRRFRPTVTPIFKREAKMMTPHVKTLNRIIHAIEY